VSSPPSSPASLIDPRSVVSPSARLGPGVRVDAFAVVGDEVELGEGCHLESHASVKGPATLGPRNHLHSFAALGGDAQDLSFQGERATLVVGSDNQFREFCTISRGTAKGGGVTRVGSHNLIMAYAHIAHDCVVGDHTVFVNGAQLAGHIHVDDYATISAYCALHQFVRIGRYSYIAANTVITQDVPPFSKIAAPRETRCQGFDAQRMENIEQAYRLLLRSKLNTSQAVEKMKETLGASPDVLELIAFIESTSDRGLTK
jgi:UDP-N-acetylglucosamine acyltransferase